MNCRHCGSDLRVKFVDLGFAPPSNAYLSEDQLSRSEIWHPLRVRVCGSCWLVQTEDYAESESLFTPEYAYVSGTSSTWVTHTREYVSSITERLGLGENSHVMELACNDGHLLRHFRESGIPCMGVEPTKSTAEMARGLGLSVIEEFFGEDLALSIAENGKKSDLIIGNNVFAHVPDINDFTVGMRLCLKEQGVITLEFPHVLNLINGLQFDTVYHEHFSYLSLFSVQKVLSAHDLRLFDVDAIPTHGGSLRIYACHDSADFEVQDSVGHLLDKEVQFGLTMELTYVGFQEKVDEIKDEFLGFLLEQKKNNKTVMGYGAAAKGNTLLNYSGVRSDLVTAVADASPSKQGMFLPGSHIPVVSPDHIAQAKPDYIVILPWNLRQEVMSSLNFVREWGAKFVTAIPRLDIF